MSVKALLRAARVRAENRPRGRCLEILGDPGGARLVVADALRYSARRIALYTESQCDETSSSARAVVIAADSSP